MIMKSDRQKNYFHIMNTLTETIEELGNNSEVLQKIINLLHESSGVEDELINFLVSKFEELNDVSLRFVNINEVSDRNVLALRFNDITEEIAQDHKAYYYIQGIIRLMTL